MSEKIVMVSLNKKNFLVIKNKQSMELSCLNEKI